MNEWVFNNTPAQKSAIGGQTGVHDKYDQEEIKNSKA